MQDTRGSDADRPKAGKGWDACKAYCTSNATFAAQAEPLAELRTLEQYTDWMKGLVGFMPDGRYELKAFAIDPERSNVCAYAVFSGTHTGQGVPAHPRARAQRRTTSTLWISRATSSAK